MFDTIKSNLEMAIRLNDKVLFDIAKSQITPETAKTLTTEQQHEIGALYSQFQTNIYAQTNQNVVQPAPNLPKACAIADPTCESCSA